MKSLPLDWHNNRLVIVVELLIAIILQILHANRIINSAIIFLFIIGWLSLRLRKSGWAYIGLSRPTNWLRTIGFGIIAGLAYQAISMWLIVPLLHKLTNKPLDLSQFESLRSNSTLLIISLVSVWIIAAFGEEMVYRGYLLNRISDLLERNQAAWIAAAIGSSVLFGYGHAYQGITGIIDTFLFGCVMAGLYLMRQRNLWLPIIAHGVYDTAALIMIFLGWYP
ncbi:MAG: hypothetical protein CVU39_25300 [Chloroflexi bacterium HGW-Chloroflexi-10]|nr:MAG: hypothetical protein CVU39_25300 [Chloroflexi bacterium HGW-Chloroflexi-10]